MEGEKWMEIRNDRLKGMSYTELGRKYHIDPRTAKRYAESPQRPEYTLSVPKPTKLDAYKQQVDHWLEYLLTRASAARRHTSARIS